MWPSTPSGNIAPMFYPLLCTSLCDKNGNLDHNLDQEADRLAQLVEHQTTVREVAGSNPGRTNTQGL